MFLSGVSVSVFGFAHMALEFFETLGELGFVVQLLVFTYCLFWLYLTFRDLPLLFGTASVAVGFLIFIHGVSVTVLVAAFVFLVLFGMQIQQVLWFGLFPLLGYHVMGDRLGKAYESDPQAMERRRFELGQKLEQGIELSEEETDWMHKQQAQSQMGGMAMQQQQMMMRNLNMG